MRISDWSSDVCSSDLRLMHRTTVGNRQQALTLRVIKIALQRDIALDLIDFDRSLRLLGTIRAILRVNLAVLEMQRHERQRQFLVGGVHHYRNSGDRKSVLSGKIVSVRLDSGGSRIIN